MGYYRFLENENVTLSELIRSLSDDCQVQVAKRHVLAISDSSEINLQSHVGRLSPSGLGLVGIQHRCRVLYPSNIGIGW